MSVTWGLDPKAQRITVYYTESSTIYEGMPVCYEFDATTNWMGISSYDFTTTASSVTESSTTAEGAQNEGKFIRVEDPDDDNIHAFAGVVAGGDHAGQTGPRAIDIYVPNGAIVPVRTDQNCTAGRTILGIHTGEQHLTGPYGDAGRPVAIACEDDNNSAAAATTLAKLDPNLFIWQQGDAAAFLCDSQDSGNDFTINKIKVTSAQTTGSVGIFSVVLNTVNTDGGSAMYWEYGNTGTGAGGMKLINAYVEAAGTAIASDVVGMKMQTNLLAGSGSTNAATIMGIFAKVHVKASCGTHEGAICAGRFSLGLDTAVTGITAQLEFEHTSGAAQTVDYLFDAIYKDSIAAVACGQDTAHDANDLAIKVRIEGNDYYIIAQDSTG
jgi:hypothetical protein